MSKKILLVAIIVISVGVGLGLWWKFKPNSAQITNEKKLEKPPLIKLVIEKGRVQVKAIKGAWRAAKNGELLEQGDTIKAEKGASASILIHEIAALRLDENTEVALDIITTDKTLLKQTAGDTFSRVEKLLGKSKTYEIETPTTVATVRGTEFGVFVDNAKKTRVMAKENQVGVIPLKEKNGEMVRLNEVLLNAGQGTEVDEDYIEADTDETIDLHLETWSDLMDNEEEKWIDESDRIEEKIDAELKDEMEKLQEQWEANPEIDLDSLPIEPVNWDFLPDEVNTGAIEEQLPVNEIPASPELQRGEPDSPPDMQFEVPNDMPNYNYDELPDMPLPSD